MKKDIGLENRIAVLETRCQRLSERLVLWSIPYMRMINDREYERKILGAYAANADVADTYHEWIALEAEVKRLKRRAAEIRAEGEKDVD